MFFDEILMKNEALSAAWRVANNKNYRTNGDLFFPDMCQVVNKWIGSEHMDPKKRLSLRTSAVVVNGMARSYEQKVNRLYQEVEEMISRGVTSDETRIDSSQSPQQLTSEQLIRQSKGSSDKFPAIGTVDRPKRKSSFTMAQSASSLGSNSEDLSIEQNSSLRSSQYSDESDRGIVKSRKRKGSDETTKKRVKFTNSSENQRSSSTYCNSSSSRRILRRESKNKESNKRSPARKSTELSSSEQVIRRDLDVTSERLVNSTADLRNSFAKTSKESDANSVKISRHGSRAGQSSSKYSTGRTRNGECSCMRKTKTMDTDAPQTRSLGVQTAFIDRLQLSGNEERNTNLPYGLLTIYDSYVSIPAPSTIVFAPLNPDVINLISDKY